MSKPEVAKALLATAETMGTELSDTAIEMMVGDLIALPESKVFEALEKCRREHGGRLTLAAIISRIDTGHLSPEEAWALAKDAVMSEEVTVVWTDQIASAALTAMSLSDDKVAARMAFLESYKKQDFSRPPHWKTCLGWDKSGREGPVLDAVRLGRLPALVAIKELPNSEQAKQLAKQKKEVAV